MKKCGILLFVLCGIFALSLSAAASRYVIDDAEVFYAEDIEELNALAATVEEECGLRCIFVSGEYLDDLSQSLSDYAGDAEDLSLFMLDMGNLVIDHYQYSKTQGGDAPRLGTLECEDIRTKVLAYINEGDCVRGAKVFIALSREYFINDGDLPDVAVTAGGAEAADLSAVDYVIDGAALFDADEIESLNALCAAVETRCGLRCIFLTGEDLGNLTSSLRTYSGGAEDLSLLAVDMGARQFDHYQYNATYGQSAFRLNNRETDDILDSILPYMKDGDYVGAAKIFISLSETYFTNDENFAVGSDGFGEYGYEYEGTVERRPVLESGVAAYLAFIGRGACIGLLIGVVVALILFSLYKRKVHGDTYPLSEFTKLNLKTKNDNFLYKNVVATKIQSDSSSGGGYRGGGGGGGGHSGGRSF